MKTLRVGDICDWMDNRFPPDLAEEWDRVGLICGDRAAPVSRILLALDPVEDVVADAVAAGAQMVITHHPLFLRGTSFVSTDTTKGRVVHELIAHGIALFNAHTNADAAPGGVAETMALLAGLNPDDTVPLVRNEKYPSCGIGRVGTLSAPTTVGELAQVVARAMPPSPAGILVGGEMDKPVQTVAVSPGSGDSLLKDANRVGADVFISADMRHHPASEHLEDGGVALICPSHWASEWIWLPQLAFELQNFGQSAEAGLEVELSRVVSEPWSAYLPTGERTAATSETEN